MKKKIFNGILLVAMLFATSSAFVSCKDNDADEIANAKIEIMKDLNAKLATLEGKIPAGIDAYTKAQIDDLIQDLNNKINNLPNPQEPKDYDEEIASINAAIDALTDALDYMVTSINAEGTYNPVFGAIALPVDVKSQILASYYGELENAVEFHGTKLAAGEIASEDAGKVYFTANPNDVKIAEDGFSLVNSQNEAAKATLTAAKSDKVLTWGWNQTRADEEVGLYEATVKINEDALEDVKFDYKSLASAIKNALSKRTTSSIKDLVNEIYSTATTDQFPRLALRYQANIQVGENTIETAPVRSGYDLALLAVKPLSYDFDINIDKTPGIESIENAINAMVDKINIEFPEIDASKADIEIAEIEQIEDGKFAIKYTYNKTVNGETIDINIDQDMTADINNIIKQLNDALGSLDKVKDLLNEVNKLSDLSTSIDNAKADIKSEITKYLDAFNNKFVKLVNSANKALQPTLLVKDGNKIHRAGTVEAGEITLLATSYTAEIVAPAYKKFIKIESDGQEILNSGVVNGDEQEFTFKAEAGKTYKVTYDAIDFFGKTRSNTYTINAK